MFWEARSAVVADDTHDSILCDTSERDVVGAVNDRMTDEGSKCDTD